MNGTLELPGAEALARGLTSLLMQAEKEGYKHDSPGTPPATGYAHGPQGVFAYPGVDQDVYGAMNGILPGLASELPVVPAVDTNPLYEVFTGVTDATGDQPDAHCDDGPTAGNAKIARLTAVFGEYHMSTQELRLDRLGLFTDRADPRDLRLVNSPQSIFRIGGAGLASSGAPRDIVASDIALKMYERAVAMHRLLAQQVYTGNPANNPAGGGSGEFPGLQILISTGQVDAVTGTAVPSLDPDVKNFNFTRVDADATALVDAMTTIWRYINHKARSQGLAPARFGWVMREGLFDAVAGVWPCAYYLGGCTVVDANGRQVQIDARDQIDLRDRMRSGKFLLIDGVQVPVILDDGIPEDTNTTNGNVASGCFASDIYLANMSVIGGRATTFWEYQNFSNGEVLRALAGLGGGVQVRGGGQFLEWERRTNACVQWEFQVNPRLIIRTPQLWGRLQNVVYCPLQHYSEPFPDDPYHLNGGVTSNEGPSLHSPWQI